MAFANISLVSTFTEWISRFNQILTVVNTSIEGLMNTSGTITITNPTGLNGNVSLNVANGVIKGDAGLLSNVRTSALSANSINVSSNTAAIAIYKTNNGRLGSEIFVSMNVSTSLADNSTANVASAQSTNTLNSLLITSYGAANNAAVIASAAFVAANAAGVGASNIAIGAFSLANTHTSQISNTSNIAVAAFAAANAAGSGASNTALGAFNLANTVNTIAIAAFAKANTANSIAVAAFDKANTANGGGSGWVQIGSTINTTSGSGWSFTDIDQSYTDLMLEWDGISGGGGAYGPFYLRMSADSGGSPTWPTAHAYGGQSISGTTNTVIAQATLAANIAIGSVVVPSAGTSTMLRMQINDYKSAHNLKPFEIAVHQDETTDIMILIQGIWRSTSAIKAIGCGTTFGSLDAGTVKLYGRK